MSTTTFDGSRLDAWNFDGSELDEAYMNGSLVFKRAIELVLPGGKALLKLDDFIAQNAAGYKNIVLVNKGIRGPIISGGLTGLNVTLINNGEILGSSAAPSRHALTLSYQRPNNSTLKVINNGWIRGAGGDGGNGKAGKDDTVVSAHFSHPKYERRKNWWSIAGNNIVFAHLNGKYGALHMGQGAHGAARARRFTGPIIIGGKKVYRFSYVETNSYKDLFYRIKVLTETKTPRTGGAGGIGGLGACIENPHSTAGSHGAASHPAGGFSGGAGGNGGTWGKDGKDGGNGGEVGATAGAAIQGVQFMVAGSKTGNVNGLIK